MNQKLIIIALVAIFIIIIAILIVLVAKFRGGEQSGQVAANAPKSLCLQDLIDIVSDPKSDKDELLRALRKFSHSFKIPPKQEGKTPSEAKSYLNFILLFASHKSADARLIAFMSNELKKANPQYANEIEIYEQTGTSQKRR